MHDIRHGTSQQSETAYVQDRDASAWRCHSLDFSCFSSLRNPQHQVLGVVSISRHFSIPERLLKVFSMSFYFVWYLLKHYNMDLYHEIRLQ